MVCEFPHGRSRVSQDNLGGRFRTRRPTFKGSRAAGAWGTGQPIAPGRLTSQAILRSCTLRWYIFFNAGVGALVSRIWKSL